MKSYENENIYRLFFDNYQGYEEMESLFDKFKIEFNAVIIDKIDGPYSRIWKILVNNFDFKLIIDDDYGSSIVAENKLSIKFLKEKANIIEKSIHKK